MALSKFNDFQAKLKRNLQEREEEDFLFLRRNKRVQDRERNGICNRYSYCCRSTSNETETETEVARYNQGQNVLGKWLPIVE